MKHAKYCVEINDYYFDPNEPNKTYVLTTSGNDLEDLYVNCMVTCIHFITGQELWDDWICEDNEHKAIDDWFNSREMP